VASLIHQDNDAMRRLNEHLGGTTARQRGDRDHLVCTIPVFREGSMPC
jgi:hypothetical protein